MKQRGPFFVPLSWPLWIFFFLLAIFLMVMLFVEVLRTGFERLGFGPGGVLLIIFGALIGSAINIPIKRYESDMEEQDNMRWFFGMRYRVPVVRHKKTVLAVNVGGCVVPVIVSLILFFRFNEAFLSMIVAVGAITVLVNRMSRVVRGVGIVVPFFIPPLLSAITAMVLAPAGMAPAVAYVSGALGTLIGADILNLHKIKSMGTPMASIGGAGTWDGIFLSSLVASLLVPAGS